MKLKNVLSRKELEKWAASLLDTIDPDVVMDVFQDVRKNPNTLVTFDEIDFSDSDELVSVFADVLGNTPCEESD